MYRRTTVVSALVGAAGLFGVVSCSDSTPTPVSTPSASTLSLSPATIAVGDTINIAAMTDAALPDSAAQSSQLRLTSSNPDVATIGENNTIVAHAPGTTSISVAGAGAQASASLSVWSSIIAAFGTTVSVSIDSSSIATGHAAHAIATVRDGSGAILKGRVVTWTSSDASKAAVSSTGDVQGVAAGTATIAASYQGHSGRANIAVTAPATTTPTPSAAAVKTVNVAVGSASLAVGKTTQATVSLLDASSNTLTGRTVTWQSSNTAILTVSSTGLVTATGAGSAYVVASAEGVYGGVQMTITAPTTTTPTPTPTSPTPTSPTPAPTAPTPAPSSPSSSSSANIVSANFDDSTAGKFTNQLTASLSFPKDPTNSGRGRVAAFRYSGTGPQQDINKALEYTPPTSLGYGSTFYFGGDLYFPNGTVNFTNGAVQRKLLYYRTIANGMDIFLVVHLWGNQMQVEWSGDGGDKVSPSALTTLQTGQWYRIETQVTMNSSASASDGVIRVWVNGAVVYQNTAVRFTNPSWTSTPFWQVWWVGQQREGTDTGGSGPVENSIDETRYWDNIGFSTSRLP